MSWFDLKHRVFMNFITDMEKHGMLGGEARFFQEIVIVVDTYQLKRYVRYQCNAFTEFEFLRIFLQVR
jgi:hypothetical protein